MLQLYLLHVDKSWCRRLTLSCIVLNWRIKEKPRRGNNSVTREQRLLNHI
ncbi:unnamed protein product [Musa hybrid cultivar]